MIIERFHLAILREVQQQGSLTAAAESLCVTQSALSHSIRKLEERLGTPLWQRQGRTLQLTQAGRHLLQLAQRLLPQLEQAETHIRQMAEGRRGSLRIGMECHPCYQWLLKVVAPWLAAWPDVDVDVKQQFQFGGLAALQDHEIDLLVTPDPMHHSGLIFEPVFDYEQVLVVPGNHQLAEADHVQPQDLQGETLITYPVPTERLDIFTQFLLPAGMAPKAHKSIETTDIMLQMVASGRGVAALPRWLVLEYAQRLDIRPLRLGKEGIAKQIHLGLRAEDLQRDYLADFMKMAQAPESLS
jgi:LysR family transcriptional regulator for metE and metH